MIRTLGSRVVYENPWLRLREDDVELGDGSPGVYAVVERDDFAVVVPWDGEAVTLVGQYRHTLGRRTWELPQGGVKGAAPEEVARTELAEETGLRAGALRHLARLDNAVGMSSQGFDVFVATDLRQGEASPEPEEGDMTTRRVVISPSSGSGRASPWRRSVATNTSKPWADIPTALSRWPRWRSAPARRPVSSASSVRATSSGAAPLTPPCGSSQVRRPRVWRNCPTSVTASPSHGTTTAKSSRSTTAYTPCDPSASSMSSSRSRSHGFS